MELFWKYKIAENTYLVEFKGYKAIKNRCSFTFWTNLFDVASSHLAELYECIELMLTNYYIITHN